MYESPINILYKNIETKMEDGIIKAVQDVNIVVDRKELVKALQYDRDSYSKGYKDGMRAENKIWMERLKDVIQYMKEVEE